MREGRLSVLIDLVIVDPAGQVPLLPEDRTLCRSTRVAQNVFVLRLVKVVVLRFLGCTRVRGCVSRRLLPPPRQFGVQLYR